MVRPITWRTIAGPSFNNSALAAGIGAFRNSAQGFDTLTDSLFTLDNRIKDDKTNAAVREALQTGQVGNLDPRADAASVYDALLGKQRAESDLETAQVGRDATQAGTAFTREQTETERYQNTDDYRTFDRKIKEAELARKEAQTRNEKTNADLRLSELNFEKSKHKRALDIAAGTDFINDETESLTNEIATEIAAEQYPNQAELSPQQMNEVWEEARARAEGREGRRIIQGRYDGPSEGWDNSIHGRLEARAEGVQDAVSAARLKEEADATAAGELSALYQSRGNFSRSVWRDGDVVPEEDENVLKAEKLGNARAGISALRAAGMKQDFSDDEKEVIEEVRSLFPNSSMLTQIVKSFTVNGKLDEDDLQEAARDGAEALLQATQRRTNATRYILQDADNPRTQRTQTGRPQRRPADSFQPPPPRTRRIRGGPNRGTQG